MSDNETDKIKALREAALHFHKWPLPGKLEITPTKPLANQRDLALAYSPGVAAPCEEIAKDPEKAADYTARSNLVWLELSPTVRRFWGLARLERLHPSL